MSVSIRAAVVVVVGAGLLGACGGGGGGGGTTAASVGASQTLTAVVAQGKSVQVYIPGSSVTNNIVNPAAVSLGATSATLNVASGGSSASLSAGSVVTPNLARNTFYAAASADQAYGTTFNNSVSVFTSTSTSPLTDASYGVVTQITGSGSSIAATVGGYHYGNATPASTLPTTTATYSGNFTGREFTNTGDREINGTANMTANFGAGTINGTISSVSAPFGGGGARAYGLTTTGTITGNTYGGTVGFTNPTTGAAQGTVTASAMNGGFYGTNGNQTAGALAVQGSTTAGSTTVTGAFGGRR